MTRRNANLIRANAAIEFAPADRPIGRGVALGIVLLLGLSYAFNGMDRQIFPALLGPINAEYGLTLAQGGFLSNAFTVNVAVSGALSGWFMARFGRKATLVGGLIAFSTFTLLTPFAIGLGDLAFYRAMTGAGEALQISAIFAMIGAFFGNQRGVYMGINNALFGAGAFLGPVLGTRLFAATGSWRLPFIVYGIVGIVMALTVLAVMPRRFATAVDPEKVADNAGASQLRLLNRNSTLCLLAFGLVGISFFAYVALYSSYLRSELHYSVTDAGTAFGMYGLGTLTAFFGGWLGERLKKVGLLAALILLALDSYAMFHGSGAFWEQLVMSFIFGALVSGYLYPRIVAITQRSVAADQIGHAMSMLLVIFYLPGLVVGYAFGKLVEGPGWGVASTLVVSVPAALAFLITTFQDSRKFRGA